MTRRAKRKAIWLLAGACLVMCGVGKVAYEKGQELVRAEAVAYGHATYETELGSIVFRWLPETAVVIIPRELRGEVVIPR